MEEMKAELQSIREELETDISIAKKERLILKKEKLEWGLLKAIPYCSCCGLYIRDWQKHSNTPKHHENRWKDK